MNWRGSPEKAAVRHPAWRRLDATDYAILMLMQEDSSRTQADLAHHVELSVSGLKKRLRKLQACGVIKRRVTLLEPEALNLSLLCFVQVFLHHHEPDAARQFCDVVQEVAEVLECHALTGEHDYLLRVVTQDNRHLQHLLVRLAAAPGVDRLLTSIALEEVKSTTALPLVVASVHMRRRGGSRLRSGGDTATV